MEQKKNIPLWLYPNVLSLDAPLVAVAWFYVFTNIWQIQYVERHLLVVLFLAVWVIYALDRIVDVVCEHGETDSPRHAFHAKHRKAFFYATCVASAMAIFLSIGFSLNIIINSVPAIMASVAFFVLSINRPNKQARSRTKNLLAAFAFAWGVTGSLNGLRALNAWDLILNREVLVFSLLCFINISAVDLWSQVHKENLSEEDKGADEAAFTIPLFFIAAFSVYRISQNSESVAFYTTVLLCCAGMYVLNRMRNRFTINVLRVLVDFVLLIPALLFGFLK